MLKKILFLLSVITISATSLFAQLPDIKYSLPFYMKSDFYQKYPDHATRDLFQWVKYQKPTAEDLKHVPEVTKSLSADGVEVVNIVASSNWSPGFSAAQTETWMAINPTNPLNIIATSNDNYSLSGAGNWRMTSFYTTDGGRNWDVSFTPSNEGRFISVNNRGTIFDPAIVFDGEGVAYYLYGFTQTGGESNSDNHNGVFVARSTSGGAQWEGWPESEFGFELAVSPVVYTIQSSGNTFHDRYSMGIDDTPGSPFYGRIYASWKRFGAENDVVVSHSKDGGFLWAENPFSLQRGGNQAPMPAAGPDGEVYVCWLESNVDNVRATVRKSTNGGVSFQNAIIAQEVKSIGNRDPNSFRFTLMDKQGMRVSSTPQIAVDKSNNDTRGNVYVIQAGKETGTESYGIYFAKSTNGGFSWQNNIRIDQNPHRNDMFFPSITVDPITGMIAVFYYSSENDPENNQGIDAIVAISEDAGQTWSHINVSPEGKTWYIDQPGDVFSQNFGGELGNVYWGDYANIVAYNGSVYPLFWAPTRENNAYQSNDLFTAIISPNPKPILDLETETVFGENVAVQLDWVNPTTNLLGSDLTDFNVEIIRNGVVIANVPNSAGATYLDTDVEDGSVVAYSLTVVDNSNRRSVPTVKSHNVGGSRQPKTPTDIEWVPLANGIQISWTNPMTAIDDTELRDLEKINFYLDGELFEELTNVNFVPGERVTHTITPETGKFFDVSLRAVGVRGGIETLSEEAGPTFMYSGAPLTELNETFDTENTIPIYVKGDWGKTDEKAASGNFSFTDRPNQIYLPNQNSLMNGVYSAPILISEEMTTLSFDQIALLFDFDYGVISITDDNAKTHKDLKWVNSTYSENFILGDLANSQWEQMTFDVSEYVGKVIMIHFGLNTNAISNDIGWFIDNLTLDQREVSVRNTMTPNDIRVNAYPNPTSTISNLDVMVSENTMMRVELYDALGSKILQLNDETFYTPGIYNFEINAASLNSGTYYCKVSMGKTVKTVPIVISK